MYRFFSIIRSMRRSSARLKEPGRAMFTGSSQSFAYMSSRTT